MKRYERFKRKIATVATAMLVLQMLTVGLLSGNVAQAATAQLVVSSPSESQVITTGLEVDVTGTVVLADGLTQDDYKIDLSFDDGGSRSVNSLSGDDNAWSADYTYGSSGTKWVSVNLLQKTWNEGKTDFVWGSAAQLSVNFTIVYPSKPATPVVSGSLGLPKDAPVANFDLDWVDSPETFITYKAAYREVGSAEYNFESGSDHILSETTIEGLKTNTEYEFVVYAFKGDFSMSEASDASDVVAVRNIVSKATSPQYSNTRDFEVTYVAVPGENPFETEGYVELWYKGPSDINFKQFTNSEDESKFITSPIVFEATEEGLYQFYTLAQDTLGFREIYGTCVNALSITEGGVKCIPDTKTIVDTVSPAVVTDLTAVAGNARVDLSWTTTIDSVPSSGIGRTDVYRDGALLPQVVSGSTFTDLNVVNGNTYSYYVVVFDLAGNPVAPEDGKSNTATATPFAPAVSAPPVVTQAVATTVINESFGESTDFSDSQTEVTGEVKSDSADTTTTTKPDDGEAETKEQKNIPLWGIIFLLVLAGIGGYLFYAQAPEEAPKKKSKKK